MKKALWFVLTLTILLCYAVNSLGAESNVAQNGSFENGSSTGPAFWQTELWDKSPKTTEYKYETGAGHTGSKFVTIINHNTNDARYKQDLTVSENKMYKLSCWIKASNIPKNAKGANISLEGKMESSPDVWETNGNWQQTQMYAKTGPGVTKFIVTVGIGTYGSTNTGQASFDDVAVEEVSSIPDGAVVCNLVNESNQQQSNNNNGSAPATGGSATSVIGWILFAGIFIIIIGFILYRSVGGSKNPKPDTEAADAEAESQPEEQPAEETASPEKAEKSTEKSDDLL